jgi:hypothetical protein
LTLFLFLGTIHLGDVMNKKPFKDPLFYIFLLFMLDFILTTYGVHIGAIYEANPLWVSVVAMPFFQGLAIRLLYFAVIIYLPVRVALAHPDKIRPIWLRAFYGIALVSNLIILGAHLYWIIIYTRMMT